MTNESIFSKRFLAILNNPTITNSTHQWVAEAQIDALLNEAEKYMLAEK